MAKPAEVERPPPPPAPTWAAYAAARQWPAANTSPFTSRGHMPAQQVDVRVSPECRASYLALVTDSVLPEGCVLAELSQVGASGGYGMQKVAGAWSFFELDPHGGVLASGTLALCGGCHAQASADGVFGLPREPATAR